MRSRGPAPSRSTSAASSGRSAAAWSRCWCRSCATRSTRRPPASRRRSPPTSSRSPCCSWSPARSASGSGAGAWCAPPTSSTRCCRCSRRCAPNLGAFLVVRALQGTANAFLTPLLLAGLADEVPPRQIGRAVGTFAAVQTAAIALAPLGGGALGAIDWRLAFVEPGRRRGRPRADAARRRDAAATTSRALRAVFTRRVGLLSAAAFTGYAGVTGVGFLVAVLAADEFGLGSITRGVLLAGFGVAGMLLGPRGGRRRRSLRARAGRVDRDRDLRGAGRAARLRAVAGGRSGALWFATGLGLARWCGPGSTCSRSRPCRATGRAGRRSSARSSSPATRPRRCCGCRSTTSIRGSGSSAPAILAAIDRRRSSLPLRVAG